MSKLLLNAQELVLVRGWLRGLPVSALADQIDTDSISTLLKSLRHQLYGKTLRLRLDWADKWLTPPISSPEEKLMLSRLEWLNREPDIYPLTDHPLDYWLSPDTIPKLASLKVDTCQELLDSLAGCSRQWWKTVPGLGEVHARQIEHHLYDLFPDAQRPGASPLPCPVVTYSSGVVPLERMLLPAELDGAAGENRYPGKSAIPAQHDLDAIRCWLTRFPEDSHTYRSYRREAERILLWAIVAKGKALSSLNSVDMADYRRFLAQPEPVAQWIGPPQKRAHPDWKPFTDALSQRSIQHANTVLNGFFSYLVELNYLRHNPITPLPRLKNPKGEGVLDINRSFTEDQWQIIEDHVQRQIDESNSETDRRKAHRMAMILRLGYATGLRLHEIANAKSGDIEMIERGQEKQYWLKTLGKGNKWRKVPLPHRVYTKLADSYRLLTGCSLLMTGDKRPLIPSLRKSDHGNLTPLALHKSLKGFFAQLQYLVEPANPGLASKISQASAHWLRHTYGSVAVDRKIPLAMLQKSMGHSNLATTSQYVHTEDDERFKAFDDHF